MEIGPSNKEEITRQNFYSKSKEDLLTTKKTLVIAWAQFSPRSKKIVQSLNFKLYLEGYRSRTKIFSIAKYIKLSIKTLNLLQKENPDVVICQLPPFVLAYVVLLYKFLSLSR